MKKTVFNTPILSPCFRVLSSTCLKLSGWKVIAENVPSPPYVVIAAPHTSNWDFPLMLLTAFHLKMNLSWMGKHTLFPPVLGSVMKWLGGIPIDRSKAGNVVQQTVDKFNNQSDLIVVIPPEGTRKKVERWKTGFYHIAHQAHVPILIVGIDGNKKQLQFIGSYITNGDLKKELPEIQSKLSDFKGIIPENA